MKIKLTNSTDYTNIYTLYDENEKVLGTKEVTLAGRNSGTKYTSWSKYSKSQIKKMFMEV